MLKKNFKKHFLEFCILSKSNKMTKIASHISVRFFKYSADSRTVK